MKLNLVIIGFCIIAAFAQDENSIDENAPETVEETAEELPEPSNEWGTYFRLNNDYQNYRDAFKQVFTVQEVTQKTSFSSCTYSQTSFERWYRSSENVNEVILSFFCMESRGYEHIQANWAEGTDKDSATFIAWKEKLSDFGITGAGNYKAEDLVEGTESDKAGKEQSRLLEAVKDQILEQVDDSGNPICANPSQKTVYQYQKKTENELYYTKFPVSCDDSSNEATYMMDVEVVEDTKFKQINDGNPKLMMTYEPKLNINYIQDMEAQKQVGSNAVRNIPALLTVALLTIFYQLF